MCCEQDPKINYIAAQVVKCAVHTNTEINISFLQKITGPRSSSILKMLFVERHNIYTAEMKQMVLDGDLLLVLYSNFKDSILLRDFDKSCKNLLDLTIIISDCPALKNRLDQFLMEDREELVENFCLANFNV